MKSKHLTILAIETSCDETAIAVLKFSQNSSPPSPSGLQQANFEILASIIASQIKLHAQYGGVVPGLAAREHEKNLPICLKKALKKANLDLSAIDYIAVTIGPGLSPALWRGINFAKELAKQYAKPIIAVNHLEGHIFSSLITAQAKITFPSLALIVSGGHTQLVLVKNYLKYKILGQTMDDAAGEAFDKVAKLLNLGYPGGPIVSKLAKKGDATAYSLPRPVMHSKNFNFSFSGLKTAVLYLVRDLKNDKLLMINDKKIISDICASFEQAVIDVLIHKTIKAAQTFKPKTILFGGGVIANKKLRKQIKKAIKENLPNIKYQIPDTAYCGDNAVMIAFAGFQHAINQPKADQPLAGKNFASLNKLESKPNLKLNEPKLIS